MSGPLFLSNQSQSSAQIAVCQVPNAPMSQLLHHAVYTRNLKEQFAHKLKKSLNVSIYSPLC